MKHSFFFSRIFAYNLVGCYTVVDLFHYVPGNQIRPGGYNNKIFAGVEVFYNSINYKCFCKQTKERVKTGFYAKNKETATIKSTHKSALPTSMFVKFFSIRAAMSVPPEDA